MILADVWDSLTRNELGFGILLLVAGLAAYVLVVTAIGKTRDVFGRRPPIQDDLVRYSASVTRLQADLAKLPDEKKFAELVSRLGAFATVTQVAALEVTFDRRLKDVDAYAHSEVHRLSNEVNAGQISARDRGERLAALEADSKTHTRQLNSIDANILQLREDLGFQKGRTAT